MLGRPRCHLVQTCERGDGDTVCDRYVRVGLGESADQEVQQRSSGDEQRLHPECTPSRYRSWRRTLHPGQGSRRRSPVVVGASGPRMIDLAVQIADGVNIRAGKALEAGVAGAREAQPSSGFEIPVFDRLDFRHPLGGEQDYLEHLDVTARTLVINAPYDLDKLEMIADRLAGGSLSGLSLWLRHTNRVAMMLVQGPKRGLA